MIGLGQGAILNYNSSTLPIVLSVVNDGGTEWGVWGVLVVLGIVGVAGFSIWKLFTST